MIDKYSKIATKKRKEKPFPLIIYGRHKDAMKYCNSYSITSADNSSGRKTRRGLSLRAFATLSDNPFLRKTPAMKYCNICRTERVFPTTEIFADFHNERYAGAYFRSNTPACGCGFPGFPASVGQPNLSIYGLYAAVETYFYPIPPDILFPRRIFQVKYYIVYRILRSIPR